MKNDKKWLSESVNELKTTFNGMKMGEYETGRLDGYNHVSMLIDYLDEPEKPVIPQFVADYIEKWKHENLTMHEWFYFGDNDVYGDVYDDVNKWLYDNTMEENRRREYLLIDAIRNGYEVEKDKKYEVTIGKGTWGGHTSVVVLYKSVGKTMVLREMSEEYYEDSKRKAPTSFWLTEKEIKDYDERYWDFAEPV